AGEAGPELFVAYAAAKAATLPGLPVFTSDERLAAAEAAAAPSLARQAADIALLIDTTGSMGDEIRYLQTEIDGIVRAIRERFANLDLRVGLVAYRDRFDE